MMIKRNYHLFVGNNNTTITNNNNNNNRIKMITKASILHMMMTYYIIFVLLSLTTITTVLVSGQQHENIIINNNNNNVSNIINSRWSNYPIYNNHNDNNGVDVHSSSSSSLSSLSSSLLPKHFKLLSSPLITQTSAIQSSLSSSNQNQLINVDEFRTNISKQFNFICNTQFGYYPDPGNCSSYYICSFGIPLHKNCSKGLYFSIRLQTCDWPANVQCEQDYLSLNAKTSMFNVIDEPKSSTSIVTTTTTTTPLPLPLLLSSDSAPLLSNSYTASPSNNHITTSPTTLTYRNISEYLRDFFNKKSNIGSSSINHHYPTLQSSSPLSSKSTLIRNLTSLNLTPPLNSLEKHNYDSKLFNKLSPTYVVDGFEVSPASTTTTNKNLNGLDKFTSHLSTFTNNSRINNAKFIEISKLKNDMNENRTQNNNQQFQKRQGFEPYWTETGYFTIDDDDGDNDDDDKRINPFTIYNDQSTPKSYFNDHHVDLHLISTNPYINNNDNKNNKRPEPLYWISNNNPSLQSRSIDSNQPRQQQQQQYSNQNIFRSSFNGYDGKNSLKKDSAIDGKLTTLKPLRRKIPELYIKIVSNDNFSTPFMSVNNNNNNNGQTNRGLIVLSKQPSPSSKAKAEKKLNYEINERLLAPFKHKTIEEDRLFSMIRSDNNIKNAEPKHRNHNGNVNEQQQKIVYSDGFNRYTDQKTTAIPTYKMINQVTHASRFRKKIIRKKKMNYQPTSSLSSLSPPSSAMAASSSSSLTNVYGHHPSTKLLTGTLVTSSFNNNNEQKIRRNSRPPLYKSLDKATTLPFNYPHNTSPRIWTPSSSSSSFMNFSPTTSAPIIEYTSDNIPSVERLASTTLKPTQRNRPQQLHETIGIYRKNNSSNKNDNINHHHKLLMKSMNNDKTESIMVVPMDSNSNKYLNLAQYNSYVVMPNSYYNNENKKNSQTSMTKNDEIQKQFKNPIDTLEEFIKKTIKDVAKIEPQKYSVTSSSMTTTTTTTPLPPPSMLATTILPNTPQGFETKKEQVYKKIKAINGYRRSRKYRPLISLDQNISTKKSNITNSHHEQKSDIVTFNNRNNSKIINLSDPSTITVYETLKNNDVDQERTSSLYKTIDDQWSLTTTSSPLLTKLTYGDRSISSIIPTTIRPENWKENIDIPTDMNTIPITSTTKSPQYTLNKPKNKTKIGIKIRLPSSTSTTTTTVPTITMLPKTGPTPKNYTEYNYYDYDNYDNVQDYNYDDEYYNNMLNDGKISTTTSTTTTTTTTLAPPSSSISSLSSFHMNNSIKRQNVTRQGKKPLIYLRNKPRPTIRRLIIKDPGENMKIISASRPQPLYPQPKALVTANKCDKRKCRLPDCRCGSSDIPGNFSSKQIPQLVMLTFDDAVNDLNWDLYEELLNSGRKNPNGCPIKATFYVSHEWTDYGQVQTLYSRGHEIASHTISHRFGEKFSKDEWIKEINGQREILNLYGGVKFEDIRGMRAPFLQTGGNNMFEMLYETNFTYDSSLPVQENHPAFWPYTLDYALSHSCNIPPCPTKSFPGVWEVGMIMWTDLRGGRCSMGDACTNPSDENGVYEMLIKNFNRHYKNNRSPFSLYYHSAWFNVQHHRKGFLRFLDEILQHQDVYMTTTWQMLQWVRQPVSLDQLNSFEPFQCNKQEKPIRECTRANICNVHSKQGSRTLRTCQECPTTFPWIGNTGFSKSKYG